MTSIKFFLEHHHRIYFEPGGIPTQISGLSEKQLRSCQYNLNSVAWILWHLARCEDVAINRIIFDSQQVLDTVNYSTKLNVVRRDIGTSMTHIEVIELSNQIDLNFLFEYSNAVAIQTQKSIRNLIPKELNLIPDQKYLMKVLFEEGALNTNSEWVAAHYSNRTKGWFLGHLGLTHPRNHLGQIILLRKLLKNNKESSDYVN